MKYYTNVNWCQSPYSDWIAKTCQALFLNYIQISPKNAIENHNSHRNVAYLLLPGASFMCKYSNMVFKKTKLDIQYYSFSSVTFTWGITFQTEKLSGFDFVKIHV